MPQSAQRLARLEVKWFMEDSRIIDLFWQRDQLAIAETSAKYDRFCFSIAYNILKNKEDSEECVNDTYMKAWNAIPPTRPGKLQSFLGKITRNLALDRYDYNNAAKRNGEVDAILSELAECISAPENVESTYEEKYIASLISQWLRQQDETRRNVFIRRYWYSDSISEVAKRFGMSEGRTRSMLFRLREKLKHYLRQEGVTI